MAPSRIKKFKRTETHYGGGICECCLLAISVDGESCLFFQPECFSSDHIRDVIFLRCRHHISLTNPCGKRSRGTRRLTMFALPFALISTDHCLLHLHPVRHAAAAAENAEIHQVKMTCARYAHPENLLGSLNQAVSGVLHAGSADWHRQLGLAHLRRYEFPSMIELRLVVDSTKFNSIFT